MELYKKRREIKNIFGYNVQLDLTKENLNTLKLVRKLIAEHQNRAEFCFADVNCALMIKTKGKFERFSTVEEAKALMGLSIDS